MTNRCSAFTLAAAVAVAAAASALPVRALAQSADQVLCDRVAADPTDPDKPANISGVTAIAPSDVALAIKYCRIASRTSRRAMYELGRTYAVARQWPNAIDAWRKAAAKGSTSAMVELGVVYATGTGLPKDTEQARQLFERAADAGNPRGAVNLAALANSGAAANPAEQRALLQRAADANSADAQYQLGMMLANGIGGPKDDVAARALLEKAAAQGHPGALEEMGEFAQTGRGGVQDTAAAKAYYEKAAALGNEDAKTALKRLECPLMIRDKQGNYVSSLCF